MSQRHEVFLTEDAQHDLQELYDYIAERDAPAKADHVLERIDEALASLTHFPDRGAFTKELLALGMREYREIHFKPYRIIYRVMTPRVYVYLVVDGRRDMRTLLERRMLRG